MTHFSAYFQRFHTDPTGWLDLYAELSKARAELPKSDFQPTILRVANENIEQSVSRSLQETFEPVSMEIVGAAGDRFQDGHWPNKMSDEATYFLHGILTFAMQAIAHIAPTPNRPLKPTIVPFPKVTVSEAALWFVTEWWLATGCFLYEIEMCKNQNRT
jgi:hypothetical protein